MPDVTRGAIADDTGAASAGLEVALMDGNRVLFTRDDGLRVLINRLVLEIRILNINIALIGDALGARPMLPEIETGADF